jgi:CRISPR/Cas system CSM-associated protein Csm3 (group 7 of RAMP superfamily)
MRLFGSGYSASRIHISDAFAERKDKAQPRKHVAVDRITGGANEGFLFDCGVVCGGEFWTTISVESPTEQEINWIVATLRALDLGICRVGSSKAGGRLGITRPIEANGPFAEKFNLFRKEC